MENQKNERFKEYIFRFWAFGIILLIPLSIAQYWFHAIKIPNIFYYSVFTLTILLYMFNEKN